jgi:hypothetical protein
MLVFDSGIAFPVTKTLSNATVSYLASVAGSGMFASVPPNEINTLTAQITEQQRALDAREATLHEREIVARQYGTTETTEYSTYIISVLLFVIIVLLVINYIFDFIRYKQYLRVTHEKQLG